MHKNGEYSLYGSDVKRMEKELMFYVLKLIGYLHQKFKKKESYFCVWYENVWRRDAFSFHLKAASPATSPSPANSQKDCQTRQDTSIYLCRSVSIPFRILDTPVIRTTHAPLPHSQESSLSCKESKMVGCNWEDVWLPHFYIRILLHCGPIFWEPGFRNVNKKPWNWV